MEYNKGNISTLVSWFVVLITPILVKYGITIGQAELTSFIMALIDIIACIYSSKHPNTFGWLGNAPEPEEEAEA